MKLRYLLLIISFTGLAILNGQPVYVLKDDNYYNAQRLAKQQIQPEEEAAKIGCQCYCSDLCGPRDAKINDSPFIDPETGICFCQQRDKDNYIPNGCHLKPTPDFASCCDR